MTEPEIEGAAQDVLEAFGCRSSPIDPFAIAKGEGIQLLPGEYDGCFDGRIEYRKDAGVGRFYLMYAEEKSGIRPLGRVRFSVSHELGHFYLPEHRSYLMSGHRHGSQAGFVSENPLEREADLFAVNLLMPKSLFYQQVKMKSGNVCNIDDLSKLADSVFKTSLVSTTIRYVQLDFEPCCAVVSKDGRALYSVCSEDMRSLGLGWVGKGARLPITSVTAKALTAKEEGRKAEFGAAVSSEVWYSRRRPQDLWEECRILGNTGLVLTLLAIYDG